VTSSATSQPLKNSLKPYDDFTVSKTITKCLKNKQKISKFSRKYLKSPKGRPPPLSSCREKEKMLKQNKIDSKYNHVTKNNQKLGKFEAGLSQSRTSENYNYVMASWVQTPAQVPPKVGSDRKSRKWIPNAVSKCSAKQGLFTSVGEIQKNHNKVESAGKFKSRIHHGPKIARKTNNITDIKPIVYQYIPVHMTLTAGHECRARLPGTSAGHSCRGTLPGKCAGQGH
jgi:hypothetical protein